MNFTITITRVDDPNQRTTHAVKGTLHDALLKISTVVSHIVHIYGRHGQIAINLGQQEDKLPCTRVLGWVRENGFTPFLTIKLEDV